MKIPRGLLFLLLLINENILQYLLWQKKNPIYHNAKRRIALFYFSLNNWQKKKPKWWQRTDKWKVGAHSKQQTATFYTEHSV